MLPGTPRKVINLRQLLDAAMVARCSKHKLFLVDMKGDEPGDPRSPGTFLKVESNEQRTAAYLGYNDAQHLIVGRTGKWSRPIWYIITDSRIAELQMGVAKKSVTDISNSEKLSGKGWRDWSRTPLI